MVVDRGALRRSEILGGLCVKNMHWNNRSAWSSVHTLQVEPEILWCAMPQSPAGRCKHRPLQTRVQVAAYSLRFSAAG